MYALTHGANMKILAGLELDSLRELYGHTSKINDGKNMQSGKKSLSKTF
jgi:hypothetical protein